MSTANMSMYLHKMTPKWVPRGIDMISKALRICSLERLKACIMTLFQTIYSKSFEWHLSLCCLDQFDHRSLFLGNDRRRDIRCTVRPRLTRFLGPKNLKNRVNQKRTNRG